MARCRVYVFTYQRNHLLPRAIKSLLSQSFTDWVCEVHNDAPGNNFPLDFIAKLNDNRFTVHNHPVNLGPVISFNYAFEGCAEDYATLLEDDNWWEPDFLSEMISLMDGNSSINVAWSNMHLWQEKENNQWEPTGKTTWPIGNSVSYFEWPNERQVMGALHSNGSMLYRGKNSINYEIPSNTLFNAVELVRERAFEHPIALVHQPLANFAVTLASSRSADALPWTATQVMLLSSFVNSSPDQNIAFKSALDDHRALKPSPVANFFLTNMLIIKNRDLYRHFMLKDWLVIARWLIKNGRKRNAVSNYLKSQNNVYQYLLRQTSARFKRSALTKKS
jgi:glycosyltransferase involved in cell wall biosynthesis